MKKYFPPLFLILAVLSLTACNICAVEKLAAEQNLNNVKSLSADTARWAPAVEKQSVLDRNAEAIKLAEKLVPSE